MAFVTGDYIGITEDEYAVLQQSSAFGEWSKYFTLLSAGNGSIWVFTGNQDDFLNMLVDESLDADIDLEFYTYILSTNNISGF